MKIQIPLFFCIIIMSAFCAVEAPDDYGTLLQKYVTPDGVDYSAWNENAEDKVRLSKVNLYFEDAELPKGRDTALAFYINAYNSAILDKILEKYPTKGPMSGDKLFFYKKNIRVTGKRLSFDTLEQKIIRPRFQEARVHFALNCASKSCPPLRAEPYLAEKLDAQLNEQTRLFLHSDHGVKLKGETAMFSKIFDWYAEDFGGKDKTANWVRFYRNLPPLKSYHYMEYDWSLNEAK